MRVAVSHLVFALFLIPAAAQAQPVTITPAIVEAGSPELIRVIAPRDAKVEGEWQGQKFHFFAGAISRDPAASGSTAWYALAGADVEAPIGLSTLKVSIQHHDTLREVTTTIAIHPAHYRTTSITVAPKFVEPGLEEQAQIEAESKIKQKIFASSADKPLWTGSFAAPVPAQPTDSFGTRRTFNGKLASIHKGADFRAASGTPVHAGNAGTVVLAQPLYYEGNCVIIDHGLGLMSLSMHLSRIDVKPGEHVEKGQRIGLSGATGRVTGPHLHWAIRWQNDYLDPVKLLRLNLNGLR